MNEQRANPQAAGEQSAQGRCVCHEFLDHVREVIGVSPEVKQHLANSRVEFLKAVRQVIDDRIERLSRQGQPGTKIAVD
ncbi:MAG TPA: hypothetical protein VN745_09215 [Verrucomicrobiae bacterium]|nr:hypothetical protein [Verrucomicrobiae bacterium]